jgi:hypothetical protein
MHFPKYDSTHQPSHFGYFNCMLTYIFRLNTFQTSLLGYMRTEKIVQKYMLNCLMHAQLDLYLFMLKKSVRIFCIG